MAPRLPSPELSAEWRRRLRASGFVDIETPSGFLDHRARKDEVGLAQYYEAARAYLSDHDWTKKDLAQRVWEDHCDGLSERVIAEKQKVCRQRVRSILADCREQMAGVRAAPKRGRPRDPDAIEFAIWLPADVARALAHLESAWETDRSTAVRAAIVMVARTVTR